MKFRKKPVVIEATQWFKHGDHPEVAIDRDCCRYGYIKTLEGGHIVMPGDWIITGVAGEHYPRKPAIFAATYEAVSEGLTMPDVTPWLLVRCDTCDDESNCHPAAEMRWSIPMPGFPNAKPVPVCECCWDGAHSPDSPLPCDWSDLSRVTIREGG